MYAKIKDGVCEKWPYNTETLRKDFPAVSFPATLNDALLAEYGVVPVAVKDAPENVSVDQKAVLADPVFNPATQRWEQRWQVVPASPQEVLENQENLQKAIVKAVEQRLNDFAQLRGYDDIKSASDYAAQTEVPKFQQEGAYALAQRAATWATLYQILAEVQAGTRPLPTGYEDVAPLLPVLEWPA